MKCKAARELMGAYLYDDLPADEMRELRLHAQTCDECIEDLRSRGAVVSSLRDDMPVLSDEERQRIVWSVKGAVKARQAVQGLWRVRPAAAFALAGVLLLGLGVGILISLRISSSVAPVQPIVARDEGVSPSAIVNITPEQEMPQTNGEIKTPVKPEVAQEPANVVRRIAPFVRRSAALASRRAREGQYRGQAVVSEPPVLIATPEDAEAGFESGKMKLPRPVDLNDAQIAPDASQE